MGWNSITFTESWMDSSVADKFVYFVHSYYVPVNAHTSAITEYIQPFSAALQKNIFSPSVPHFKKIIFLLFSFTRRNRLMLEKKFYTHS